MNGYSQNTNFAGEEYAAIGTDQHGQAKAQDARLSRDEMLELAKVLDKVLRQSSHRFKAAGRSVG